MEQSLTICCSPKTYRHIRNDEKYRLQISEAICKFEGRYKEVVFTEQQESTPAVKEVQTAPIYTAANERTTNDDKQNWHDAPTKLMLSLVHEMRPNIGKTYSLKTRAKMFQIISNKMSQEGCSFTSNQIQNKFRGLERRYKNTVLNNRKTGRNRQTCAYEDDLKQILGGKKGIHPEFLLDSGKIHESSISSIPQGDEIKNPSKDNEPRKISKKKIGAKGKVLKKVQEMVVEKQNFYSKLTYFMQRREERCQKKLELLKNQ